MQCQKENISARDTPSFIPCFFNGTFSQPVQLCHEISNMVEIDNVMDHQRPTSKDTLEHAIRGFEEVEI